MRCLLSYTSSTSLPGFENMFRNMVDRHYLSAVTLEPDETCSLSLKVKYE